MRSSFTSQTFLQFSLTADKSRTSFVFSVSRFDSISRDRRPLLSFHLSFLQSVRTHYSSIMQRGLNKINTWISHPCDSRCLDNYSFRQEKSPRWFAATKNSFQGCEISWSTASGDREGSELARRSNIQISPRSCSSLLLLLKYPWPNGLIIGSQGPRNTPHLCESSGY